VESNDKFELNPMTLPSTHIQQNTYLVGVLYMQLSTFT